ncbi:sigma-70 family RNA polymerase sigma factor, partial [Bacteroides fragilis]
IEEIVTTIGINKQSIYNLLSSALKIMRKHKIEEAVSLFVLFIIDRL